MNLLSSGLSTIRVYKKISSGATQRPRALLRCSRAPFSFRRMATTNAGSAKLPAFLQQSKTDIHSKFVDLEWQQRDRLAQGFAAVQPNSTTSSKYARLVGDAITLRNRYANVEPFAENRIKLAITEGQGNDYINASPIVLGTRRYIATQGPKDINVNHFYRMVASETSDPAVIVMLTQAFEQGKEKCFQYYPLTPEESPLRIAPDADFADGMHGTVELLATEDSKESGSQIRRLRLQLSTTAPPDQRGELAAVPKENAVDREIYHLLFSGWPDFLVPEGEDRHALLQLVRLSARLNRAASSGSAISSHHADATSSSFAADLASTNQDSPRIIHCSAGVGRSGTFIALDYLLSLLYTGELDRLAPDADPIAETVNKLRQQRMMMVQGEGQFFFLYEVLKEAFLARAKGGAS